MHGVKQFSLTFHVFEWQSCSSTADIIRLTQSYKHTDAFKTIYNHHNQPWRFKLCLSKYRRPTSDLRDREWTFPNTHTLGHAGVRGRVKRAAPAFLFRGLCWYVHRCVARLSGLLARKSKHGGVRTLLYLFNTEIGVTAAGLRRSSARHNWLRNDNKHSSGVVPANLLVFSQSRSLADITRRLTQSVFHFLW